jgi:hypothetical protein
VTADRPIAAGQAVIGVLMLGCATFGSFPSPVPLLFVIGAVGTANAVFALMRTFGSALLGGVAAASIALAAVPFSTCASAHPSPVFSCTGEDPSLHLAGTVVAAGLCGASLVLARVAAQSDTSDSLARLSEQLTALRQELHTVGNRPDKSTTRSSNQAHRSTDRRRTPTVTEPPYE